ncbi:exodeoxyribonuclease VII large subunit [Cryobacterium sp. TMT1-62]|uniref:exodeoxyribonuclease VII large subunit n=1 Tax=unclassified Cryobacterium TaxID=2649013 RepID=UPI0010693C86|nr:MULTISPECIES: exodeoxyribonuclease VII large subunit [unclassified Cryobacterium]TFB54508.1 exodeoxyribonuclease VII large subunit [Cryobacterium sp. Sr3]TFC49640.1 exodeoxyribonuclease VII large subunit [Cryobacterium sp. TMT2-17-1]TFC65669.1 exodeoxyribonuclease VII large subunit [Cryobacterium sp. TMT2-4]TFD34556.1 exodeoxyribonuclease VII large subunit [Cryobacterium sp. TMT1-62]
MTDAPPTLEAPWPVGLLANKIRGYIERLGTAWVEGEITQWGASGGNVYGKLKDLTEDATVGFTIWSSVRAKLTNDFKQGDRVIALVKPNYWVKGGTLTMQMLEMRHVGLGDMLERLERLRNRLAGEGLFDASRKKPLPFLPHCIGLVTGKDSDAEKDVIRNAQLRWPAVTFDLAYAAVQGDRMVSEVTAAIQRLDADPEVDVIIVARGGGDFQNLLGFSDETLIRAAAACTTPLVSAIGHEADRPLLDDVADLRASTPTDAAKRVVPDVSDELNRVQQARARLSNRLTGILAHEVDRIGQLRSRPVLSTPEWIIDSRSEDLTRYVARGAELIDRAVERAGAVIVDLRSQLRALSPQGTLDRGYSIVQLQGGQVVRSPGQAPSQTKLLITLAEGALAATADVATSDPTPSNEKLEWTP